jgi:hypothetical protein
MGAKKVVLACSPCGSGCVISGPDLWHFSHGANSGDALLEPDSRFSGPKRGLRGFSLKASCDQMSTLANLEKVRCDRLMVNHRQPPASLASAPASSRAAHRPRYRSRRGTIRYGTCSRREKSWVGKAFDPKRLLTSFVGGNVPAWSSTSLGGWLRGPPCCQSWLG